MPIQILDTFPICCECDSCHKGCLQLTALFSDEFTSPPISPGDLIGIVVPPDLSAFYPGSIVWASYFFNPPGNPPEDETTPVCMYNNFGGQSAEVPPYGYPWSWTDGKEIIAEEGFNNGIPLFSNFTSGDYWEKNPATGPSALSPIGTYVEGGVDKLEVSPIACDHPYAPVPYAELYP